MEPHERMRRLVRLRHGRLVGGICAGIAAYCGWSVFWVRAAFFVAIWIGAIGPLAYLVLWAAIPGDDSEPDPRPIPSVLAHTLLAFWLMFAIGYTFFIPKFTQMFREMGFDAAHLPFLGRCVMSLSSVGEVVPGLFFVPAILGMAAFWVDRRRQRPVTPTEKKRATLLAVGLCLGLAEMIPLTIWGLFQPLIALMEKTGG